MCGIAGIVHFTNAAPDEEALRRMVQRLAHRGPDGEGSFVQGPVALGHRRLAIIDLAGGQQPLANEDETVWITFNGEIYNYRQLRDQLKADGHRFRTNSDTEVIVHAYEQWGPECVRRLRGMFAFCLADFRQRRLLLARDPFGIKTLYVQRDEKELTFASELPALLAGRDSLPTGRLEALDHYLQYRFIPAPDTVYAEVSEFPPATYEVVGFDGNTSGRQRYWRWNLAPEVHDNQEARLEQFNDVLRESVSAHLVADVPFGVFLSGGIDSSLIASYMAEFLPPRTPAFAIGFDDEAYSEIPYAEQVATTLGLELHTERLTAHDIGHFCELAQSFGEPFADTSAIPTWCVSRLARQSVPMVLSGDGGDELFAGYDRYDAWMWAAVRPQRQHAADRLRVMFQTATLPVRERMTSSRHRLIQWQALYGGLTTDERGALWRSEFRRAMREASPSLISAAADAKRLDRLSFAQLIDLETYLPSDVLKKVDITSMTHGLEVRTPFLDVHVAAFAGRLPVVERRWSDRWGGSVLKVLPKRALEARFSREFIHRQKRGFCIPERVWLRPGSPVRVLCDELLRNPRSRIFEFFSVEAIAAVLADMEQHNRAAMIAWTLLILALWLEANKKISFAEAA